MPKRPKKLPDQPVQRDEYLDGIMNHVSKVPTTDGLDKKVDRSPSETERLIVKGDCVAVKGWVELGVVLITPMCKGGVVNEYTVMIVRAVLGPSFVQAKREDLIWTTPEVFIRSIEG